MHVGWGTHLYTILSIAINGKYIDINVGWGTHLHDCGHFLVPRIKPF